MNCHIRGAELCHAIAEDAIRGTYAPITRSFDQGVQIVDEGDSPGFLGVLRRGYGREGKMRLNGDRVLFGLAAPGDIVGALPGRVSSFSLEAATDVEVCMFDIRTVERLMRESVSFRHFIVQVVDARHHRLLDAIWRYGSLQSRERIIAFLLTATEIMPTEPQPDGSVIVTIEVPRRDWAELTNTTVETISRTMRYLADKKMVTRLSRAQFRIHDLDRLALLAGVEPPKRDPDAQERPAAEPSRRHEGNVFAIKGTTTTARARDHISGRPSDVQEKVRH